MVAQLNRTAGYLLAAVGLLVIPATVQALPIQVRIQPVELAFDFRDDPNGMLDAAGEHAFPGLMNNAASQPAFLGGIGGGGGMGGGGGAISLRSGSTSQPRGTSIRTARNSTGNSGGFRGYNPAWTELTTFLLPTEVLSLDAPTIETDLDEVARVPEPASSLLFGAAVAIISIGRIRSRRHNRQSLNRR